MEKINRPLVWVTFYFVLGILGGTIGRKSYLFPLFLGCLLGLIVLNYGKSPRWLYGICALCVFIGYIRGAKYPTTLEKEYFKVAQVVSLTGKVKECKKNAYGQTFLLEHIIINEAYPIKSKLSVYSNKNMNIKQLDCIKAKVKIQEYPKKMNPSDMDYGLYLKGKGVVALAKGIAIERISSHNSLFLKSYNAIKVRLYQIFKGGDKGIVAKVLLGDTELEDRNITDVYYEMGVGHILSLSGFHIGVLLGISLYLFSILGLNYTKRYLLSIPVLWGYTVLTGMGTASVRACMMATIWIIGRCLWQEEDDLISLSIAAFLILFINPYEIYQIGFIFTFLAMLGLIASKSIMEQVEVVIKNTFLLKGLKLLVPTLVISLVIAPVIIYHFYKVPFLSLFLNLLILPIFGVLIPGCFILVGVSFLSMPLAQFGGEIINFILMLLNSSITFVAKLPLATLCIGVLKGHEMVLYYSLLFVVWLVVVKRIEKKYGIAMLVLGTVMMIGLNSLKKYPLEITQLYVGQGDCTVIVTPYKKVWVIDSGSVGKGKTLKRYLNYKGYDKIDVAILSHGHEDHIGGFIDLLQEDFTIDKLFIGKLKEDDIYAKELQALCKTRQVPLLFMAKGKVLTLGQIKLRCLAPIKSSKETENDASLICILNYKAFSQLFTGDVSIKAEDAFLNQVQNISALKVAHHGSATSTSNELLLKTTPKWSIISCGIGNRFGHPSGLTLERMGQYPTTILSTDRQGCIILTTDGTKIGLKTQLEGGIKDDKTY